MIPFFLASGLLGLLLWHICFGPDIWYHLFLGKTLLETGSLATPHNHILLESNRTDIYWLFQVISYGAYKFFGLYGLTVLFGIIWTGIFFFWLKLGQITKSPVSGILLFLGAIIIAQNRFEFRPEVFAYLFLVMELWILERWGTSLAPLAVVGLFFIQALWTNCHGFFALGPLIFAGKISGDWAEGRGLPKRCLVVLVILCLATFCSPYGLGNWVMVLNYWHLLGAFKHKIQEADPPYGFFVRLWSIKVFLLYWILTALVSIKSILRNWRRNVFEALIAFGGLFLSAVAFRNIPLLVLLSAPLWCASLPSIEAAVMKPRWVRGCFMCAAMAVILILSWMTITDRYTESMGGQSGFGVSLDVGYPIHALKFLETYPQPLLLFNNPESGGFLEFHFPGLRLFGDSFFTDASADVPYFCALVQRDCFEDLRSQYHFNSALFDVESNDKVFFTLFKDPQWQLAEADLRHLLFVFNPGGPSQIKTDIAVYRGEDLSPINQSSALVRWSLLAGMFDLRDLWVKTLSSLTAAKEIPSPFFKFSLTYGIRRHDKEMLQRILALYPKMKPYSGDDAADMETLATLVNEARENAQ